MSVSVFGWSRGYAGFRSAVTRTPSDNGDQGSDSQVLVSTSSGDGVHWTAGRQMIPIKAVSSGFGMTDVTIDGIVEGPAGLIAYGSYPRGVCGGPATVDVLWSSTDGIAWTQLARPSEWADASVVTLDAGSAGYVATGVRSDGIATAWTSTDARKWRLLSAGSASATVNIEGGTAFAGGFVVAGSQELQVAGCGRSLQIPSVWWSADGNVWTTETLPGVRPAESTWVDVNRLSDHAVLVQSWSYDTQTQSQHVAPFISHDGQTWLPIVMPGGAVWSRILSDGAHNALVSNPASDADAPLIRIVADDGTVVTPAQSGEAPTGDSGFMYGRIAVGPTGLVELSSDGSALWLGLPRA